MKRSKHDLFLKQQTPQYKAAHKGFNFLSDAEILSLFLANTDNAIEIANDIYCTLNGDLTELSLWSVEKLCNRFKKLSQRNALSILASFEIAKRKAMISPEKYKITSSQHAYQLLHPFMSDLQHEEFWIILLNRANRVIKVFCSSSGGISGTVTDVRIIFKSAVDCLATAIILAHNHPSGNLKASEQDIQITKRIKEAGKLLEIPVVDHLIITNNSYYSFGDEGLMR